MASGAAVFTSTYGSSNKEAVLPQVTAWAQQEYGSNSVVFSAILLRLMLFSEALLCWQHLDDKSLWGSVTDMRTKGSSALRLLQEPWPDGSTGELLVRMEQDVSLVGTAYIWKVPDEPLLVRLRPDWTTIISELVNVPGGGQYRRRVGYWVEPPKTVLDQGKGQFYPADEVAAWAPIPDPQAAFRGMSWLTPVYRDVKGDDGMTTYKIKYLDNAASPNMLIKYAQKLQPGTVDAVRERMQARYAGPDNAFKTLVLDQGADATVIGNSLQQMDFSGVAAAGEQRILAAAMVPGVLVGLEPLRGAGRGYQESMQKFANIWARPQWRSACGALSKLVAVPDGSRLWFDASDIAALQDGEMEKGQTALVKAQALLALSQANYTHESSVAYITSMDPATLKENPIPVAPPSQPVQHLLPQTQPGVTASPLPPASPRLPVGPASPGQGGDGRRPIPRATAARRAITTGANGHG
jgi:hypothetical protein